MVDEVVYHIGRPKTGTTVLQFFLHKYRTALLDQGICYPDAGIIDGAHHLFATAMLGRLPPALEQLPRQNLASLQAQLRAALASAGGVDRLVLSTEYFALMTPPGQADARRLLRDLVDAGRRKVVVYFRDQLSAFESAYSQEVRNAMMTRYIDRAAFLQGYLARKGNNYHFVIRQWAETFGEENLIARYYAKTALHNGDITYDFFDAIGAVRDPAWNADDLFDNPSLSVFRIELINRLSRLNWQHEQRQQLYRLLSSLPKLPAEQRRLPLLTPDEVAQLLAVYEPINAGIESWLPGFRLSVPDAGQDAIIAPALTRDFYRQLGEVLGQGDPALAAVLREQCRRSTDPELLALARCLNER